MKEIKIIFMNTIFDRMEKLLKDLGVKAYTIVPELWGRGLNSEPKYHTHIWPGFNMGINIVCDNESAEKIINAIDEMKDEITEPVFAYTTNVELLTKHNKTNKI